MKLGFREKVAKFGFREKVEKFGFKVWCGGGFAIWFQCESDVVALGFFNIWSIGGNYCWICQVSA